MFRHSETGHIILLFFIVAIYGTIIILRKRIKYFIAPETVIKKEKRNNILFSLHIFPSIIFALLTVLKVLPIIPFFEKKLEENGIIIPVFILSFFFIFSFLIGLIIEKVFERNNEEFKEWKRKFYSR